VELCPGFRVAETKLKNLQRKISAKEENGQVSAGSANTKKGRRGIDAGVNVSDDIDVNDAADEEEEGEDEVGEDGERELWRVGLIRVCGRYVGGVEDARKERNRRHSNRGW
jgi:hypothetical protein